MSSLPLRFLASWQAKQFSFRIGATCSMKLTGWFGAGCWAWAGLPPNSIKRTSAAPINGHSQHQQAWDRTIEVRLLGTQAEGWRRPAGSAGWEANLYILRSRTGA